MTIIRWDYAACFLAMRLCNRMRWLTFAATFGEWKMDRFKILHPQQSKWGW